ncbi:hypothetical protein CBR_g42082 [Chara braunii]|uniref:DCD domain-containing protein n=1 Tax=Chara braunii TaxID=69332 RepID=A0A388LX59_CHABU|nr:hypothetical protein CBR_g42082 [Chara braunii]|eukprot:GBG86799.1 hypothetical protein CBR_g42082 [Chara braunii]
MRWEKIRLKSPKGKPPGDGGVHKTSPQRLAAQGPGRKWGHTCNAVQDGKLVYVFGGYGKDERQTNDIHAFDTVSQTWKKPSVKGSAPTPRDSHTCTTVGNKLFVFGGTDGNNPLRDLHVLDTVSNVWSKPRVKGDIPSPREGHSAALIGNRLFVFGGCGKASDDAEETYFNDLYILDTETMWWSKGNTTGTAPAARDSHTCSSWGNSLVVIGGEDSNNSYLSDVYILNAESLEWKQLETTGQKLSPRAGHAAVSIGKYIIIFGGFTDDRKLFNDLHILDIETGEWTKSNVEGARPSPRFSLAGDCVDDQKGLVFFIGGCNDNLEALDDIFFLETGLQGPLEKQPVKNVSMKKELKKRKREEAAKHSISAAAVTAASAAGKDSGGVKLQNQSQGNNEEGGETEAEVDGRAQTDGTMMDCSKHVAAITLGSCAMAAVDNPLSAQRSTVILALSHAQGTAGSATPTVAPGAGAALVAFSPPVPGSMYTERKPKHIEKIFEATVSDVFHFGYCISANIDGQPMKGMLFSYKPGFAQSVQALMFRKQLAAEAAKEKEKEDKKAERKAARAAKAARLAEAAAAEAAAARAALFATPTKMDFNHCPPVQMIEFLDGGVANYCGQIELQHHQHQMMLSEVGQQEGGHQQASNQEQGGVQPQEGQEQQQVEQGSFEGQFQEKHDDRDRVQYCVEVDGDRCGDVDDTEEVEDGGEDEGEDAEEMDEGEDGDEGDEDEEEHEDYEQQMHGVEHETGPYHEPVEADEQQEYAIEMQQAQQQECQQDQQHYLQLQTPQLEHEYVSVAAQIDPSSGPCSDFPGEMHTHGHKMVQHFALQRVDIHEHQQQQGQQEDEDTQHQQQVIADYPAELHGEGPEGEGEADGDYDSAMEQQVDEEEYVAQIQTGDAGQGQQEHYEGGQISQGLGDVTVEDYRQHIEVDEGQEEYPGNREEEGDGEQQYNRETSEDENEGQNGSEMATACKQQQYGHMQQQQQECESYASSGMQSPAKDNVQQRMSEQRHFAAVDIRQHGDQQQQQQHYLTSPSEQSPKQYLQGDAAQRDQQQQQQQQHHQQQLQQHYSPAAVSQKQHHYSQEHFQGQPLQHSPQRFAHRQSQQHQGAQSYPHPHAMSPQQFHHHHHQQQQQQQQQMAHGNQGQPYHRTHQPPVSPQHHRRMQQTHQVQVQSSQAVMYGGPHHHPLGGHMMGTSPSMVVPSPHQQAPPYSDGGLVDQGMATIGLGHGGSGQISHQQGTTRMYMGPMSPMSPTTQGGAASGGSAGNLLGSGLNIGMGQPMDAVQQVGAAAPSIPDHSHQYQMYGMGMGGMPMHYPHDPHHQTLRRE